MSPRAPVQALLVLQPHIEDLHLIAAEGARQALGELVPLHALPHELVVIVLMGGRVGLPDEGSLLGLTDHV